MKLLSTVLGSEYKETVLNTGLCSHGSMQGCMLGEKEELCSWSRKQG